MTHNLISSQDSSVPLPKFQMAPRLKILMSSGSKRGTQIYYPFLPNVLESEFLSGSPTDPLWVEMPISRASLSSRIPNIGALPIGPPNCASSERDNLFLEPPHPTLKVPVDEPPSRFPNRTSKETPVHRTFYIPSSENSSFPYSPR